MINVVDDTSDCMEDIISLWQECFHDDKEYIIFFLKNCPEVTCISYTESGKIISMLFLLDGKVDGYKCKYLYAACTSDKYRGRGIMGELIEFSKLYCYNNGYDSIVLVPAEESLYMYYSKFGFLPVFQRAELTIPKNNSNLKICEYCETDDCIKLAEIRIELIDKIDSFRLSYNNTVYSIKEHFKNGGSAIYINSATEKAVAFIFTNKHKVIIKELLSTKGLNSEILSILYKKYSTENVYIQCPIVYNVKDNDILYSKCGMIYPVHKEIAKLFEADKPHYSGMYLD